MSKEKIKIELRDWDYTCGDGCCTSWGTDLKLNGESLDSLEFHYSNDFKRALEIVLEHLGYDLEIEEIYDD